jgi:predicted secreted protein
MQKSLLPRFNVAVLVIVTSLALLSATATAQQATDTNTASTTSTKKSKPVVGVMESDNGKTVDMDTSQTLRVKLKVIAGNGYGWTIDGDPAPLKLIKNYRQQSNSTARRAGGPEMAVFEMSASSAGVANLTFVYRRSWEYNVPPAKTFTVRVNVR